MPLTWLVSSALATGLAPADWAERIRADRIEADLRVLTGHDPTPSGQTITSRHVDHPDLPIAGAWLTDAFSQVPGAIVTTQPLTGYRDDLYNVVADLPGAEPELPPLILAAHYDSTASFTDGWDPATDPAPGADDDASGIALLLEVARALSGAPAGFSRTVRFIAFSAEEVGLVGSELYVAAMDPGDDVLLALVFDPVGYNPGDVLWFTYDAPSVDYGQALIDSGEALDLDLEVVGVDEALIGGDSRSDHYPFWLAGFPALHVGSWPQPPSYHTTADELEVVDVDFLSRVTAVAAAHAADLAEPVEPVGGCGCAGGGAVGAGSAWLLALLVAAGRRRG